MSVAVDTCKTCNGTGWYWPEPTKQAEERPCPCGATPVVEDEYSDEGFDSRCQTCAGDGFEWCEEWDCWQRDCDGDAHTCPNCRGSGAARDQWYW